MFPHQRRICILVITGSLIILTYFLFSTRSRVERRPDVPSSERSKRSGGRGVGSGKKLGVSLKPKEEKGLQEQEPEMPLEGDDVKEVGGGPKDQKATSGQETGGSPEVTSKVKANEQEMTSKKKAIKSQKLAVTSSEKSKNAPAPKVVLGKKVSVSLRPEMASGEEENGLQKQEPEMPLEGDDVKEVGGGPKDQKATSGQEAEGSREVTSKEKANEPEMTSKKKAIKSQKLAVTSSEKSKNAPAPKVVLGKKVSGSLKPEVASGEEASKSSVVEIQQQRHKLLSDVCHKHHRKDAKVGELISTSVNKQNDFIYCRIAKVATTTWKRTIADGFGVSRRTSLGWVMRRHLPEITNYNEKERRKMFRNYYKFMFVRHPFERLVSAWRNKFVEMDYTQPGTRVFEMINKKIKERYRLPNRMKAKVTFREFVRFLLDPETRDVDRNNRHWRPYHKLCQPCSVHYHFIGHYETLHQDSRYVLDRIGLSAVEFPQATKKNTAGLAPKMMATLSRNQYNKLKEMFRIDFLMFGYSFKLKS